MMAATSAKLPRSPPMTLSGGKKKFWVFKNILIESGECVKESSHLLSKSHVTSTLEEQQNIACMFMLSPPTYFGINPAGISHNNLNNPDSTVRANLRRSAFYRCSQTAFLLANLTRPYWSLVSGVHK